MLEKHRASLKLEESINSSFKLIETFFDTNDFDKVISMAELRSESDIFHSAVKSELIMMRACLTFDEDDLNKVPKTTLQTIELCDKFRRKDFWTSLTKMWKTPDYDKYEEIELHAEMTYGMIMGMSAVLGLVKCHNFVDLIRMINRLWLANKAFKELRVMFKNRTEWETEKSRLEFEAGIRLERAVRNIFISYLPPKLLRVVNFLGLKGRRNIGFNQLNKCAFELTGIYSLIAEASLLLYNMYVETHGSLGPKNLNLCEKIINKRLESHPNNFPYKFLLNKLGQLNGNVELSVENFKKLLNCSENHLFDKLCHWEMMWSYALMCEWEECIKYAALVRKHALHSPAIFTYLEAIFRYVKGREDDNEELIKEATKLFQIIPSLKIRFLGNVMTYEKAVIESSKFFIQNNFIMFPIMDMLYSGNMFSLIDGNMALLERFMIRVDKEVKKYAETLETGYYADNYLDALFYKGVILKHMRKFSEGQECFKTVIKEKDRFESLLSIPPQSLMELGLIEMSLNNFEESKTLLNKVLSDYSDYVSEHLVHIRCYSALREMGVNTDKENECEVNIMEEYAKTWLPPNEPDADENSLAEIMAF